MSVERHWQKEAREWLVGELGYAEWVALPQAIKTWLLRPWLHGSTSMMRDVFSWFHGEFDMTVIEFGHFVRELNLRQGYEDSVLYHVYQLVRPQLVRMERYSGEFRRRRRPRYDEL